MSSPTQRELALETLLREQDAQVAELVDEVKQLRKYLNTQSTPSRTESVTLPPTLLALLQPLISGEASRASATSSSSTITTGLLQRTRVLQEENDELYELLRTSETGKLKEEVRSLKRVVTRLQQALEESDNAMTSLSQEVERAHLELTTRQSSNKSVRRDSTTPPDASPRPPQTSTSSNSTSRPIPTGPRAFKKPRLSETRPSPPRTSVPPQVAVHSQGTASRSARVERSPRDSRMEVEDERSHRDKRQASPERSSRDKHRERVRDKERDRDRDRDKERDKDRERNRERERGSERERPRDRDRESERTGEKDREKSRRGTSGNGGRGRKIAKTHASQDGGDRSLAQRMGL